MSISVGDTVHWKNDGKTWHTVTSSSSLTCEIKNAEEFLLGISTKENCSNKGFGKGNC